MEYFRKIVTYNDGVNGNIGNYLANFGFVGENDTSLAGKDFISSAAVAKQSKIFYKNDDLKQCCVRGLGNSGMSLNQWADFRYLNSTLNLDNEYNVGSWYGTNYTRGEWIGAYTSLLSPTTLHHAGTQNNAIIYSQLSLIKTKNNGFIWNNVYRGSSASPTNLCLATNDLITQTGYQYPVSPSNNCSLIGIPPVNNSAISNYIYISWTNSDNNFGNLLWDCLNTVIYHTKSEGRWSDGQWTDLPGSKLPNYEWFNRDISFAQYTNLNKNVCVLIKMPYQSGYLENVYLMSTAPSNFKSGGVFSFAGRTFMNLYSNVVIELPTD